MTDYKREPLFPHRAHIVGLNSEGTLETIHPFNQVPMLDRAAFGVTKRYSDAVAELHEGRTIEPPEMAHVGREFDRLVASHKVDQAVYQAYQDKLTQTPAPASIDAASFWHGFFFDPNPPMLDRTIADDADRITTRWRSIPPGPPDVLRRANSFAQDADAKDAALRHEAETNAGLALVLGLDDEP